MKVLGIIPARFHSTRLPGKPLKLIGNKPMIQWVYENAKTATLLDELIVATDDRRIFDTVSAFGGKVEMTAADHPTGTDRLAEVARRNPAEIIINIQGDEVLINQTVIDAVTRPLLEEPELVMTTAKSRILDPQLVQEPSVVKVVTDNQGYALFFSRAPIPYPRNPQKAEYWKHIGIYGYRRDFLLRYSTLPQSQLEQTESLEQLRALANGYRVKVVEVDYEPVGVDTPEDLERVRTMIGQNN
ncbi:MAG TPA: 3-deoxy-manno-octulosonate cytidylyltransferase [Bacillota bacterium]